VVDHRKVVVHHRKVVPNHRKVVVHHRKFVLNHRKVVVHHRKSVVNHRKVVVRYDSFGRRAEPVLVGRGPTSLASGPITLNRRRIMGDFLPRNDEAFRNWMENFLEVLGQHLADFGLVADDLTAIQNVEMAFSNALNLHLEKRQAAKAATAGKNELRRLLEGYIRPVVRRVNNHPSMSNELRVELGLSPREAAEAPTPIEALVPLVYLTATNGQVAVHWGPNPMNEHLNGKPEGVKHGIIYRKREGDAGYSIVGIATSSPYYDPIVGPATDYTYVVRYRGAKQTDLSPQSEAATIAARGDLAA